MMDKKDIIKRLDDVYNNWETAMNDEPFVTIYKRLNRLHSDLGDVIQELEDEPDESKETPQDETSDR